MLGSKPASWTVDDQQTPVITREYQFPGGLATCCVIGFGQHEWAVFSPPADLDDEAFADLDTQGTVTAIIPPNGYHSMGRADFVRRSPDATLSARTDAAERIARKQPQRPRSRRSNSGSRG